MPDSPPLDAAALAAMAAQHRPYFENQFDCGCRICLEPDNSDLCKTWPCDATVLLAELAHAHALLDALVATVPVESAYTYSQCAYCDGLQTPLTTVHAVTCPWDAARRYRAGG